MAKKNPKRQWKTGTEYEEEKRAAVTDVLTLAASDEEYRARLLSKCPQDVLEAFNEVGNFEKLPYGFRIECFEREGPDIEAAPTDNTVILVLPELGTENVELPEGGAQYWQCTYLPYKERI